VPKGVLVITDKNRLGVNIDHIATLRQARGESYPSLVDAAKIVFAAGADQLTVHLREDQRHIQKSDMQALQDLCRTFCKPLNFEMSTSRFVLEECLRVKPAWVCLVPERRLEQTTEGGLNLLNPLVFKSIAGAVAEIREFSPKTKISLFVEASLEHVAMIEQLKPDAVEVHTGAFAHAFNKGKNCEEFKPIFQTFAEKIKDLNISLHAGHGLTLESTKTLVSWHIFSEFNIGHALVCDAIFLGLEKSVSQFVKVLREVL
jgi:pyridoxine 5-phosphate synthase